MTNPIKDNRIINDKTFAIRLRTFIKEVNVNCLMDEEEKDYLLNVIDALINYQVETATSIDEINYLDRVLKVPGAVTQGRKP